MILSMTQEKNKRRRILTISDAISAQTGLGRIHRDLVTRMLEHLGDVFEVATMGYGGVGTTKIKVPQLPMEGMIEWVLPTLPAVCDDFFGKERGIVMFIWDAHRTSWFSQPVQLGGENLAKFPGLKEWLVQANIEKWIYAPIDSSGPNDRLSFPLALTLGGFDRILAYGEFGEGVIRRSIGDEEADKRHLTHLPHGLCSDDFYQQDRALSRKLILQYTGAQTMLHMLGVDKTTAPIAEDEILIGCVCTNQARKDLQLAAETVAILSRNRRIRFWLHTDQLERAWSIPSLLVDYGILHNTIISMSNIPDLRMATAYSACDLTIAPGLGEGMGYTIFESLFCGTPCIHTNYGGAPQWMGNPDFLVEPVAYRYEGSYASKRPVCSAQDWADKANALLGKRINFSTDLDWDNLWPKWEHYLRDAAK
jgi:glycosyltransferase involved in cell wall biosynthesis